MQNSENIQKWLPVIVSGLSLIISFITLYLTRLRNQKLKVFAGPQIIAGYDPKELYFVVPTSVVNASPKVGVILKSSLTIARKDTPQQNFYMAWSAFYEIGKEGTTWIHKESAHAIPVLGYATATRAIKYPWADDASPNLLLRDGVYTFRFDYWSDMKKPFATLQYELLVKKAEADQLSNIRSERGEGKSINKIVYFVLAEDIERNRLLTEHEVKRLLD
jgi:hypothetical protein